MMAIVRGAACLLIAAFVFSDGMPVTQDQTLPDGLEMLVEVKQASSPALPLTVAKSACQAGWLETKKQCNIMTASTSESADTLKSSIKVAGESVLASVMKAVGDHAEAQKKHEATAAKAAKSGNSTQSGNATMVLESAVRSKLASVRLGENADAMDDAPSPAAMKTLAHMSCQALWQVVESVCTKVDSAAEEGQSAVAQMAASEGKGFTERTQSLANTDIPEEKKAAAATPAGNGTRLGDVKFEEDQSMGSLDSSDRAVQDMYKSINSDVTRQ